MTKSLPNKLHLKQQLYSHHMLQGTSLEEHLTTFQDIFITVNTGKNSIFLKNGKTVILVGNWKFTRSRMKKRTSSLNSSPEI